MTWTRIIGRLGLALGLALGMASAAPGADFDCLMQPRETVAISSPVPGYIERVAVDRGDLVRAGTVIVQLEASLERASVAVAQARVDQEAATLSAKVRLGFGVRRYDRTMDMFKKELVSLKEMDEAETAKILAEHGVLEVQENIRVARLELERAHAALVLRTIRSPFTGIVTDRLLSPGELVDKAPILKLARIDPLRVEVFVPVAMLGRIAVGSRATVIPEAPVNTPREATVIVVDRIVDAASGTFGVRLEMPNPDNRLPAGLKCKTRFAAGGREGERPGR